MKAKAHYSKISWLIFDSRRFPTGKFCHFKDLSGRVRERERKRSRTGAQVLITQTG